MHPFTDVLQDLDVDGSCAAVVAVVLELLVSHDTIRAFFAR